MTDNKLYTCPICEFSGMEWPAEEGEICPCCGNEFGYDDANTSHTELRQAWIDGGTKWWCSVIPKPEGYSLPKWAVNSMTA